MLRWMVKATPITLIMTAIISREDNRKLLIKTEWHHYGKILILSNHKFFILFTDIFIMIWDYNYFSTQAYVIKIYRLFLNHAHVGKASFLYTPDYDSAQHSRQCGMATCLHFNAGDFANIQPMTI